MKGKAKQAAKSLNPWLIDQGQGDRLKESRQGKAHGVQHHTYSK